MAAKRVLLMVDRLGRGGAAQVVVNIALGLDRSRFSPVVCTTRTAPTMGQAERLQEAGIPLLQLDRKHRGDLRSWRPLLRLMSDATIVHAHESGSNFWARVWGKIMRVPIIVTHDHTAAPSKGLMRGSADRLLRRWSDRIVTVSEFDRQLAIEHEGIDPKRISAIYNGIDAESFASPLDRDAARKAAALPQSKYLIAVVARLVQQKNHATMFGALAQLPEAVRRHSHCVLVGDGPLEAELRERARACGLEERVSFLGARDDVDTIMRAADALVLPSNWECLPVTLLEALASRCPVVATAVGGVPEVLREVGWPLVRPGRPIELAQAIESVLLMPREQRERQVEIGYRTVVERFSRRQTVDAVQALYDSALRETAAMPLKPSSLTGMDPSRER